MEKIFIKKLCLLTFTLMALSLSTKGEVQAAIYYIDGSNGSDKNAGNFNSPWKTLNKANSIIRAGDTVCLRGGEYKSAQIAPVNSGKTGKYIIYQNYENEKVIIFGANTQISLNFNDYIKISGINFRFPTYRWATILNCNYLIIDKCSFEGITSSMDYNIFFVKNCDYAHFIDSSWDGINQTDGRQHDMAVFENMSHSLWLRCYFGSATHDSFAAKKADSRSGYNVIKGCTFENLWRHSLVTGDPYHHWLIEKNTFKNGGSCYNSSPSIIAGEGHKTGRISSTIKHDGISFIIRNNILFGNDIDLTFRSLLGGKVDGLWFYHNTSYNQTKALGNTIGGFAIYGEVQNGVTHVHVLNNIFWKFEGELNRQFSYQVYVKGKGIDRNKVDHNIFGREGEPGHYRWDIGDIEIRGPLKAIEKMTNSWENNLESNPKFVDADKHDFKLNKGSPAIDAAIYMTLTKSGTESPSTSLVCNDVSWAFSGPYSPWSIDHPDISSDKIYFYQIDGTWVEREIRSIDYEKKEIKLNLPATWKNNTPIYYKKFEGAAPDIGAYEFVSDSIHLKAPENLTIK